jgi:hypothetical protein
MLNQKFTNARVDGKLTLGPNGSIVGTGKGNGIPLRGLPIKTQAAPATATTAATLTAAQLLTGLLNATPTATGATVAYTLPTGTLMDGAATMAVNDSFDWVLINNALAALDTITLTAGIGHTIVGGPIVQSLHASTGGITGYSAVFRTRKTAANTVVTYRIG